MNDRITEQEFHQWKQHNVTKKVMNILEQELVGIDETIVEDSFLLHPEIALKGAQISGFKSALLNITELTLYELNRDDDEGEAL